MKYALNFEAEALGDDSELDEGEEEATDSFLELDEYLDHECEACAELDQELMSPPPRPDRIFQLKSFGYADHRLSQAHIAKILNEIAPFIVEHRESIARIEITGFSSGTRRHFYHAEQRAINAKKALMEILRDKFGAEGGLLAKVALAPSHRPLPVHSPSASNPEHRKVAFLIFFGGGAENFDFELERSAYPGISCVTPGNPYVLHCFPPFKSELTKEHHDHLDIIAEKIRRSFSTSRPITKVMIVGHSSTWHETSRSDLELRAFQRAGNAGEQLILRLNRMGLAKRVDVETDGRSDTVRWLGKPYSSTSGSQQAQNDRALNRRVEITLNRSSHPPKPLGPVPTNESFWRMRPPVRYQANRYICWAAAISSWSIVTKGTKKFKTTKSVLDHFRPTGVMNADDSLILPDGMEEVRRLFSLKFKKFVGGGSLSAINIGPLLKHSHLLVVFRRPGASYHHFVVVYGVDRFHICFMDPELNPGAPDLDKTKKNRVCARIDRFGAGATEFFVFWKK